MMTSDLLFEEQGKILKELEERFDQWILKRKSNRTEKFSHYLTVTKADVKTRECKRLSTDSSSSSSLHEDATRSHHEFEQDSAYFSEEDFDLENLSLMAPKSGNFDGITKWQLDSHVMIGASVKVASADIITSSGGSTDILTSSGGARITLPDVSAKKVEKVKADSNTVITSETSVLGALADIAFGDPLQESRDVYKESVFGTYVASELMELSAAEARVAKIEILKLLNKYTTSPSCKPSESDNGGKEVGTSSFVQERSMLIHKQNTVRRMQALSLADSFRRYDYEDIRNIPHSTTIPSSWSSL